jgi:hypothetical protein
MEVDVSPDGTHYGPAGIFSTTASSQRIGAPIYVPQGWYILVTSLSNATYTECVVY